MSLDDEKRVAAEAAADLIEDGMTVGLGTGSTVAHLLAAVARRGKDIRCVSTSPRTEEAARGMGIRTESFDDVTALDLAIDGADQVSPDWWLVKGGGAAHTREKLVAAAAERFIVIVDSSKLVDRITAPIPLELLAFGLGSTLARLGDASLRDVPRTPDDGVIADYTGPVADPAALAAMLSGTPGVVDHGLFPPGMVAAIVVGEGDDARWLERLPG
ncbi:MAG: ribose-5-phosphate isomerase RpiA [Actinomycetota bacterium]|nr:ribose-5-phosphate isomerase RpiA [Actinomycetota bacterium]